MRSPARPAEAALVRHRVVRLAPAAWAALAEPLVERLALPAADAAVIRAWAACGRPLMVRRAGPCEAGAPGVPLGLPLPPSMGKRRIALMAPSEAIASSEAPPALAALRDAAPEAWRATLDALDALARRHRIGCRAFGSLAWQALTGLPYLSSGSDLDLLFELPAGLSGSAGGGDALAALLDAIAASDRAAPMRIDGELIRADGAGANWREWHAARGAHDEIVVKTAAGVALMTPRAFLEGAV
ncbi:malonate decarboxylase holo-[acyl-carrier-protein] synthase [Burkholderia glumae]|uniref:Malonate decarboxylase holo-[acyl-carrier-protein] synthase n=1 Tax=Burkholderia glumae TaxID=337 RepID=A0AAP9Y4F5_BURGL|nr:malonate decarboxylase holo-[acyl-carrier-protein] synthase [Burkholderia glumae]ACR28289.1 Phosphoribosyl-dephospho-CoA transferase [Burkholderia glumae BGR1]AJY66012.1 malonate decarboxylase holo-[acyl-carrier-protein] synthase [Burkholderia glumae LMG 2196 = ATCC 33617]KHJ61834.1 phosphoribosyl-dephospho-CoA transferase [Burkholderia glumae]MCM2480719.1 malonate decarboxylase holo-[acyl-carrier-protein] synthase [Burkholderia glumae]MCM2509142.1 malonate decarboxylase holo-[acyl-carrier-